jgi:hypothetical protein
MERLINIATVIFVLVALAATAWAFWQRQQFHREIAQVRMEPRAVMSAYDAVGAAMTEAEATYLLAELDRRQAGDCAVESTVNGWFCTQHDGKKFYVRKP